MPFDPHGEYELSLKGEIVVMRFYNSWNLEGAKQFFKAYQNLIQENHIEQFGVLSDLNRLVGGTPEAMDYFSTISDWSQKRGQLGRAVLMEEGYKEYTINRIDKGKTRFPVKSFSCEDEAFEWLAGFGLKVEN